MKISCYRCGGDGKLPQFDWNKGGVCFTCGGDGIVNTFSTISLNKKDREATKAYLKHSGNRDLLNVFLEGEAHKLDAMQLSELTTEIRNRAHDYYGYPKGQPLMMDDMRDIIKIIDEREKNMPKPYEKNAYFTAGKVSLVPVHWLKKFQGNNLRRDDEGMKKFAEELLRDGLKEPAMLMIGQADKTVGLGEGNHRMNAYIQAGLDFIPVRVSRRVGNVGTTGQQYYDKMSRVPIDDYYQGDASPEEVFDTFYDHDYITPMSKKFMKKLEFDEIEVPTLDGKRLDGATVKGIFGKQFENVSKSLMKQLNEMMDTFFEEGGSILDLEEILTEDAGDWKSKADGMLTIDIKEVIPLLDEKITDLQFEKIKKAAGLTSKTKSMVTDDTPDYDDMDLDDLDALLEDI